MHVYSIPLSLSLSLSLFISIYYNLYKAQPVAFAKNAIEDYPGLVQAKSQSVCPWQVFTVESNVQELKSTLVLQSMSSFQRPVPYNIAVS